MGGGHFAPQASVRLLSQKWSFTQVGGGEGTRDGEWVKVSAFPTTVHVELLKLQRVPDPFVGLNEWDVQWVGESEWAFKCIFDINEDEIASKNFDIVFEGVDTFAEVALNGHKILETRNQFVSYRVPIKRHLRVGVNQLVLTFESAFLKGRGLEKEYGNYQLWNGDSSRLHVRKAQYNYGWDWGPVIMTIGPWKPVFLHMYEIRITDLDIRSKVSESLDAHLTINLSLSSKAPAFVSYIIRDPERRETASRSMIPTDGGSLFAECHCFDRMLQLWYPVGYGEQPMYTVEVRVSDDQGNTLDSKTEKIAFRRARVVQEKLVDQDGLSFFFEINNIRMFCGGSNWIPADSFLTTITPDRYRAWLQLFVEGNQNMVRVWGGGIYEADIFYEICDELGVLVWQDFMFACGQYPAYDSFLDLVEEEAKQNVMKLRHHPSIVIFAGNNEDYQLAEQLGLELDYSDEKSDYRKTNFPARHIYERVLPTIVGKLSDVHYHRSSPYSGQGQPTTDQTLGDLHQWNVWHGSQEPWQNWDKLSGRFVSEFGMQGYPNVRTFDYWLNGNTSERFPQSRTITNHNKAAGFERRLELYLVENFRHSFQMDSYAYCTQIMQAETLSSAYRTWRRNWRGKGKEYTSGALVWQMNDCWPCTSWAIVDYFLRPKPSFFAIARELRPFTVGITRIEKKRLADDQTAAYFTIDTEIEIWGTNSTLSDKSVTMELSCFDLHSDLITRLSKEVVLTQNSSTELHRGKLPGQPTRTKNSDLPKTIIASARILDEHGIVLARHSNWPEPFKFIKFPPIMDLGLKITADYDSETIQLSAEKPIKGIILDVEGDAVKWSDQAIDLVPNDPQTVTATGLNGRDVKVRYLGDGME